MGKLIVGLVIGLALGACGTLAFKCANGCPLKAKAAAAKCENNCGCSLKAKAAADDPIYVLCRFDLKEGNAGKYAEAVRKVTDAVRAEKGCRFYTLVGDTESGMKAQQKFGPDVLWMVECWDNVEALKAHLASPHMKAFGPTAAPLRKSNTFHVLKEMK